MSRGAISISPALRTNALSPTTTLVLREYIVRFILTGVRMARDTYSRSSADFQEAIFSSGVCTRQTHGADAHVKVKPLGSRLIFDGRGSPVSVARVYRRPFV